MSNGESPQPTRRTTRSSILSTPVTQLKKACIIHKPSMTDLIHVDEPISLDDLLCTFPGRSSQISQTLRLLGPLNSPMSPLFIYGGASTGKTSTILQIFRHLRRPFVYTSCITCHSPRILFESVLNQLMLHKRNSENSYSSAKRCEKTSDFVNFVREALVNALDSLKLGLMKKLDSHKEIGKMLYLIIDNLEVVRDWDKSSSILPLLFGLHNTLKLPELGIIFISRSSPDNYYSGSGFPEPVPVYFPSYTEKELRVILLRQHQENKELYSWFLDAVLMPFCRISRRVDILSTDFDPMFKKYCEPLLLGGDDDYDVNRKMGDTKQQREETKRKLYNHIKPHISTYLNVTFRVRSDRAAAVANYNNSSRNLPERGGSVDTIDELGFHMSMSAKYVLISAFIASRNPATLDATLFDTSGGLDNRKKRKCSAKNMEQKETTEKESLMKGPGTFPLERLLAIYQCITSVAENYMDESLSGDGNGNHDDYDYNNNDLMCDALLQVSSLCNANLIFKGGSCPLECSTRYRCAISEELAVKVARSLKFPLSNYLYRR